MLQLNEASTVNAAMSIVSPCLYVKFQNVSKNMLGKHESIEKIPAEEGNPSASRYWLVLQVASRSQMWTLRSRQNLNLMSF